MSNREDSDEEYEAIFERLVDGLTPRVDRSFLQFLRSSAGAGEWDLAIDSLIASLNHHSVPLSPREFEDLSRLVDEWEGSDPDALKYLNDRGFLDSITVVDAADPKRNS